MTDHPSLDELADLAEDLATDPATAEHAAGCEQCSADLTALAAVRTDLADLPAVAIPADVAARLDARLAEESLSTRAPATVVPLAARRRRLPAWVAAAAVLLVAVGGSALLVSNGVFDGLAKRTPTDAAGPAPTKATTVIATTGFNYTASSLPSHLTGLLSGSQPVTQDRTAGAGATKSGATAVAPGAAATPAPMGAAAPPQESTLADQRAHQRLADLRNPAVLARCLVSALGTDVGTPLAVDLARFDGTAAVIVAYANPTRAGHVDVYVLDPTCPIGSFRYFARLAVPQPK